MKNKIIYIVLSVIIGMTCVATSCTSDMEPESLECGDELRVEVNDVASRSIITTNSNLTKQPFALFGDMYRTGEYYPGLKIIFSGRKVTYKNEKWDYGTPIYWLMGQEHSFVAIHPYLDADLGITDWSYSDSQLSFTYTVPKNENDVTDYDKVKDILYATHRRKYDTEHAGAIKFEFRHLMSQINIEPALNEVLMYPDETNTDENPYNKAEYIQIKKFELFGLKTTASFTFKPSPFETSEQFQTDACLVTYKVDDNSMSHAVMSFVGEKQVTNNNENVNICNNDDTLLVLPQEIDKDAKIVLYYTVNGDHTTDDVIRRVIFPLSGLPIKKWEAGKIYTYKFTIEKAYTSQIKEGSIKWEVRDRNIPNTDDKDKWIADSDTIRQEFDCDDDN